MRKLLLAVLGTALFVSSVHATLAPPVVVRPRGELPVVTPQRGNTFAIEIVSPVALPIDDLRIEGEGWTVTAIDAPDFVDLVPDEPLVVTFDAVTRDPEKLLRVSFYVGQTAFVQDLDYSPRARAMRSRAMAARDFVETPVPDDADAVSGDLARRNRTIQVFGRWFTTRPDGVDEVIPGARVVLWEDDVDPNPDDFVAETWTNSGGAYSFTVDWSNPSETHPDFYVVVWLENRVVRVQNVNGDLYGYRTPTIWNFTEDVQNVGNWYPASGEEETGFIFNRIERGHGMLWTDGNGDQLWDTPKVDVQWDPNSTAGSNYSGDLGLIRMRNDQGFHEHTILHEYGHHWMEEFGFYPSGRTYCNGECDATASSCGHCLWCNEDEGMTITEGFANFVGEFLAIDIASRWNGTIYDDGTAQSRMEYFETTIVNSSQCTSGHVVDPLLCEGNFAALLRDIADPQNDDDPNWGPGTDAMTVGYEDVLETFDARDVETAWDFLGQFADRYPSRVGALAGAGQNNGYFVSGTRANLEPFQPAGWAAPVVPRGDANASQGSVSQPIVLVGNQDRTYFNASIVNSGGFPTASEVTYSGQVDGVTFVNVGTGKLRNGFYSYINSFGPHTVRGGLHTYGVAADVPDDVSEGTEGDNAFAAQYSWTPLVLSNGQEISRAAPPLRNGGASGIPVGTTRFDNVDGFRLPAFGDVQGVAIHPGGQADYDLRRYATASSNATNGFRATDLVSQYSGSSTDFVLFNRRTIDPNERDLGVLNYSGDTVGFRMEVRSSSTPLTYGDVATVAWGSGDVLYVGDVSTPTNAAEWTFLEVEGPVGSGFEVIWYDLSAGEVTRSTSGARGSEANGKVRLTRETLADSFYPFAIVRDRDDGLDAATLTVRFGRVPPDLATAVLPGSAAAIVPRDAEDPEIAFGDPVPAPGRLVGDAARTAKFVQWRNDSPNPTSQYFMQWQLDGVSAAEFDFGTAPGNSGVLWQVAAPFTVRGGSHTVGMFVDSQDGNAELFEDNNRSASQWVWEPREVGIGTTVVRAAPPARVGGWNDLPVEVIPRLNADGVRTPEFAPVGDDGQWVIVALSPGAGSDYDPHVFEPSTGPSDGFASPLVRSLRLDGLTDYCVLNLRNTPQRVFDVGAVSYGGSTDYRLHLGVSTDLGALPVDGGRRTLAGGIAAEIFEVAMDAGEHLVRLVHDGGDVDWGVAIHGPDQVYASLTGGTVVDEGGVGQGEEFAFTAPITGRYAVVVYKDDSTSVMQDGQYSLQLGLAVTNAPAAVAATRLVGAAPNPFNPRTEISFEVAREGHVVLEILDVAGRRVRTLVSRSTPTGRHRVLWNGVDDQGRSVSSGVYFLRLTADGTRDRSKIVLLK